MGIYQTASGLTAVASDWAAPFVQKARPRVAWALPLEESVYAQWFSNFLKLETGPEDYQITTEGAFIDAARNKLVQEFLTTDAEYLFFVDSDTCPPPDALARLLAHHKPVVGGWYRTKKPPHRATVYRYVDFHDGAHYYDSLEPPEDEQAEPCAMGCGRKHARKLEPVDALGFGCILIRRDVFDKTQFAPGRWFSVHEGGTEDMFFARALAKVNIPLCVDWGLHCRHIGLVSF